MFYFSLLLAMSEIITKEIPTKRGLIEFRFEPLQVCEETIFATYCSFAGVRHCFHLATNPVTGEFIIMDKKNCPFDLQDLEHLLSDAIYNFHPICNPQ